LTVDKCIILFSHLLLHSINPKDDSLKIKDSFSKDNTYMFYINFFYEDQVSDNATESYEFDSDFLSDDSDEENAVKN